MTPSLAALLAAAAAIGAALRSVLIVGPERRKTVEEAAGAATTRATNALELALTRLENDNARWREDFDELDTKLDKYVARMRRAEAERDRLAARVERMVTRFAELGVDPPA